jgi:hypothetical protein
MKEFIISSVVFKIFSVFFLIWEFYLKGNDILLLEKYLNVIMIMVVTSSCLIPKFFIIHIIQFFHFTYLLYLAVLEKQKKLENLNEEEGRNLFMSFVILFSSQLDEIDMTIESGKYIINEFKFFLLNGFGFMMVLISLILLIINYCIDSNPKKQKVNKLKSKEEDKLKKE